MSHFVQFVARVHVISRTGQPEVDQRAEVEKLLGCFVWMRREAHSCEPDATERVRSDLQHLHDRLRSEIIRRDLNCCSVVLVYERVLVSLIIGALSDGRAVIALGSWSILF